MLAATTAQFSRGLAIRDTPGREGMRIADIPDEMKRAATELEGLGGGDARLGRAVGVCKLTNARQGAGPAGAAPAAEHGAVVVRDPRLPLSAPAAAGSCST